MRVTIDTDEDTMQELMRMTGERTKSGAVRKALTEWVEQVQAERMRGARTRPEVAADQKPPEEPRKGEARSSK